MPDHDRIPELALEWHREGRGAVIATVIQTWGSAPRGIGSQLVVSGNGEIEGSVSGGCVEGAVIVEAQEALVDGTKRELEFGVSDGDAFTVGLACGGTIRVLVEPVGSVISEAQLEELCALRAARTPVALVSNLDTGERRLELEGHDERFRLDKSGFAEDGRTFVAIHNPPLRLLIVGAVHIAQALVPMARIAGFDPLVIDPRETFGAISRFPGETVVNDWPDEVIDEVGIDARTAVVLLSHDPKLDDPALIRALKSECYYIGALGSRRTQGLRRERMAEAGFTDDEIARIHGPVGLSIGSMGPAEIAVSILSEMIAVLRKAV